MKDDEYSNPEIKQSQIDNMWAEKEELDDFERVEADVAFEISELELSIQNKALGMTKKMYGTSVIDSDLTEYETNKISLTKVENEIDKKINPVKRSNGRMNLGIDEKRNAYRHRLKTIQRMNDILVELGQPVGHKYESIPLLLPKDFYN